MKKGKKLLALLLILGMLFALFSGCSQPSNDAASNGKTTTEGASNAEGSESSGGDMTLSIWHQWPKEDMANSHDGTIWNNMTDEYVAANPDVKFDIMALNQADLHVKIQASAAANDLPDVFILKGSWVSNFVKNNLVLDFVPYLEKCPWKDAYKEGVFDPFTRDGKIYGMPVQFSSTSFVYYNEDMWKSIGYDTFPTDWEEIKAAADKFNEQGIIPFAAGNKDKWFFESVWLSTLGDRFTGTEWTKNIIENNGKAKFTDPEFVASLQFLKDMADAKFFNPDFNSITNNQAQTLYAEGKAATMVEGYWAIASILNQASEEVLNATKITILPPVPDQKGDPNAVSGGGGWSIAANNNLEGAKRDQAADYCVHMTGEEFSKRLAEDYGEIGACNVGEVDMTKFDHLTQDYVKLVNSLNITPIYDIQMDGAVIEVMNTALQEMLNGAKTPEEVAEEIQAAQDKLE